MNFADVGWLWLLVLVLVYWGLWVWLRRSRPAVRVSSVRGLKKAQGRNVWRWLPWVQMVLAGLVVGLLVVALARPQSERQVEEVSKKGVDIVLALDVSGSMMAEDLQPNRMEAAKESIGRFIDQREDDRMGVVVFAGKAFTQSPLTFDYDILREYLDSTSTETVDQRVRGLSGTAIGDAILAGISRFDEEDSERSKVLILATDGDANVGVDPQLAVAKAADEGVRVYTIGIGSEEGALIPTVDAFGRQTYMTDEQGQPVRAVFNEEALERLAVVGGGKYFRVDDTESFDAVLAEIDELEKTEAVVTTTTEYEDNHEMWLWAAGGMLVLFGLSVAIRPMVR